MASDDGIHDEKDGPASARLAGLIAATVGAGRKFDRQAMRKLVTRVAPYMRVTKKGIRLSGKSLSDLLFLVAPRIPARDLEALKAEFGGVSGAALAARLIRTASRNSAGVGAATGALASAGELAPPLWVTLPVEIVVETLAVAAIEMRLLIELHTVYEQPITGEPAERAAVILACWADRKGVKFDDVGEGGLREATSKGAKAKLMGVVRRKLITRATQNLSSLAPLFVGAVAAAEINRRATRDFGDRMVRELSKS